MKIILFSDIHLANYKQFHEINDGYNSRMIIGIEELREIGYYAYKNKIRTVVFCGDLFDNGSHLQPDLLEQLVYEFEQWKKFGLILLSVPGQHDYHALNGIINAVEIFPQYMTVVRNGKCERVGDLAITACWHSKIKDMQLDYLNQIYPSESKYNLFIGHFLVKELLEANSAPFDPDCVSFDDLPKGFDLYAIGDYHPHVWIPEKKLMSVGLTHQHSWRDKNCVGSFIVYDFEANTFERIYSDAPQFIEIDAKDVKEMNRENFYEVKVSDAEGEKALSMILPGIKFTVSHEVPKEASDNGDRIENMHFSMDKKEIVKKYLEFLGKDTDEELMNVGKEYLEGKI